MKTTKQLRKEYENTKSETLSLLKSRIEAIGGGSACKVRIGMHPYVFSKYLDKKYIEKHWDNLNINKMLDLIDLLNS